MPSQYFNSALDLDPGYLKARIRRAQLFEQEEKFTEALQDFEEAGKLDADNREVRAALVRLPPLVAEQQEKMKAEMLDKLKDLGNTFLKPFGLSTSNFQMSPQSGGGYSMNFTQNPAGDKA